MSRQPALFQLDSSHQLETTINNLTDLQIRLAMREVFAPVSEEEDALEIDAALIKMRNEWSEKNPQNPAKLARKTMALFHQYFTERGLQVNALLPNGTFTTYITSFIENEVGNHDLIKNLMYLFCDYLCRLSTKPLENQQLYLQSFPPSKEYLKCLDGTLERIEELHEELISPQKYKPFLHSHDIVMRNAAEILKHHVNTESHTHIPSYFEYSLGIKDKKIIHPQSQIPTAYSWAIHASYAQNFKAHLALEINKINQALQGILSAFPNSFPEGILGVFEFEPTLFQSINSTFAPFEIEEKSFLKESAIPNKFCFDQDLLNQAITNSAPIKFLNELVIRYPAIASASTERQELVANLRRFETENFTDCAKILFSSQGANHVTRILSEFSDEDLVNPEELLVAVEALWMMGEKLCGNSPIQFIKTIQTLNNIKANYLKDKIAPKLQQFYPAQVEKIERIAERYEVYKNDLNLTSFFASNEEPALSTTLPVLFYGNASSEDLMQKIEASEGAEIATEFFVPEADITLYEDLLNWAGAQLVFRPDRREILCALGTKSDQYFLANLVSITLQNAASVNDLETCKILLNNFTIEDSNQRVIDDVYADHYAAQFNNVELLNLLFEKGYSLASFLDHYNEDNKTPIEIAAIHGSVQIIESAAELAMSSETFTIQNVKSYYPVGEFMPLYLAAYFGNANVISVFAKMGFNLAEPLAFDEENFLEQDTAAHCAAFQNHPNVIRVLRSAGLRSEDLNLRDSQYFTPFEAAAYLGYLDVLEELHTAGIAAEEINQPQPTETGDASIHLAARQGHSHIISMLHDFGANLDQKNQLGETALNIAIQNDDCEMIKALHKAGANLDLTPSLLFSSLGRIEPHVFKTLCDCGTNVFAASSDLLRALAINNRVDKIKFFTFAKLDLHALATTPNSWKNEPEHSGQHDTRGKSALMLAAENKHGVFVQTLIKNGVDFVGYAAEGLSSSATQPSFKEFIHHLNSIGFNLNQENAEGHNLLTKLASMGKMEPFKWLCKEMRMNPNQPNSYGETAIHVAARKGDLSLAIALKNLGVDLIKTNNAGHSPAYLAAKHNHLGFLHALGSNINEMDEQKHTPLIQAIIDEDTETAKTLILSEFVDINLPNTQALPLHYAAYKGNLEIVKLLLNNGAKAQINTLNKNGYTPLDLATIGKKQEVATFLNSEGANFSESYREKLLDKIASLSSKSSSSAVAIQSTSNTNSNLPPPPSATLTTGVSANGLENGKAPSAHK